MNNSPMRIAFLKRALPFLLTLIVGVALGLSLTFLSNTKEFAWISLTNQDPNSPNRQEKTSVIIHSVPQIDFTKEARKTDGFVAGMKFQAVLDANGKVSEVKPISILPDGITNHFSIGGENYSAFINDKLIFTLPYGMTNLTLDALNKINFTPAKAGGKSISTKVEITYFYDLMRSPDCTNCSTIMVTITDRNGYEWTDNYYLENVRYK